jgi:eukaryotic-like serine/threonine-protein kinase
MNHLGRYQLGQRIGAGASGVVYRAYDPLLDRAVAIKVPRPQGLKPEELQRIVKEFHHEGRIAGKFSHQNIVTIHDIGSEGETHFIVMEFVPGRSLLEYTVTVGPLPVDEVLYLGFKCCLGLAHMHFHGVIHRDVKPANIIYHPVRGIAKLMDFSISHSIEQSPARLSGSLGYMAPEHFDSTRSINFRTDLFALGSSLYKLISGRYPFEKEHTAYQVLHVEPKRLSDFRGDVPDEVQVLVSCAMAKESRDRYESASEMARAIESVLLASYPTSPHARNLIDARYSGLTT